MDAYTILLFLSICRAELVSKLWWILMWKGLWSGFLMTDTVSKKICEGETVLFVSSLAYSIMMKT